MPKRRGRNMRTTLPRWRSPAPICRGSSRPMGLASWQRSGSLNGWQDFGHEDAAVTRNDQMRAHQLGSLLPPAGEAQLPPPVYTLGRLRADTPATADSRDRSMSGYVKVCGCCARKSPGREDDDVI